MKRKAYDFFFLSVLSAFIRRLILFELEPPSESGIPLKCLINCVSLKKSVFGSLFLFVDWREELTLIKSEKLNKYVTSRFFSILVVVLIHFFSILWLLYISKLILLIENEIDLID